MKEINRVNPKIKIRVSKVLPCIYYDKYFKIKYVNKEGGFTAIPFINGKEEFTYMITYDNTGREVINDSGEYYFPCGHNLDLVITEKDEESKKRFSK